MNITIGHKIFAVAGLLVALMAAVAGMTTWKLRQASQEVDTIALYLLPLANRVSGIQAQMLRQEIVLQRILAHIEGPDTSEAAINRDLTHFEEIGAEVDQQIAEAASLADQSLGRLLSDKVRVEMSRISSSLWNIEQQHGDIHDLVVRFVEAHQSGHGEAAETLGQVFSAAQIQVDESVTILVSEIVDLSERMTLMADEEEHLILKFNLAVTALAVVLGLLFAAVLTRSLVRPLHRLRDGTQAVQVGDLSHDIPVTTRDEIADLTRAFNHMLKELRAKEDLKKLFGTYVDPRVVETVTGDSGESHPEIPSEKKQVTVFFSDIANFTAIGERLSPVGLVRLINEYLSLASAPIIENDGVIDKYMGDGVMSFWCQPFVAEGAQAKLACQAALNQFDQLKILHGRLPDVTGLRRDLPEIQIRIGLASGEAIVGSIGSEYAKNFTVMGDTVNIASRLEGANKVYGTKVLVCEETWNRAGEAFEMREIDSIAVQGKIEPLRIFELLGAKGSLSSEVASARDDFEAALVAYRARNWEEAERLFGKCLKEWPNDKPASVFLERIKRLRASPPPETWDGVWSLNAK